MHWAAAAPDRAWMAERDRGGGWRERHLCRGAGAGCGAIGQALLDRGLSADRPLLILSGNSSTMR